MAEERVIELEKSAFLISPTKHSPHWQVAVAKKHQGVEILDLDSALRLGEHIATLASNVDELHGRLVPVSVSGTFGADGRLRASITSPSMEGAYYNINYVYGHCAKCVSLCINDPDLNAVDDAVAFLVPPSQNEKDWLLSISRGDGAIEVARYQMPGPGDSVGNPLADAVVTGDYSGTGPMNPVPVKLTTGMNGGTPVLTISRK
jgi:hypothetical protein